MCIICESFLIVRNLTLFMFPIGSPRMFHYTLHLKSLTEGSGEQRSFLRPTLSYIFEESSVCGPFSRRVVPHSDQPVENPQDRAVDQQWTDTTDVQPFSLSDEDEESTSGDDCAQSQVSPAGDDSDQTLDVAEGEDGTQGRRRKRRPMIRVQIKDVSNDIKSYDSRVALKDRCVFEKHSRQHTTAICLPSRERGGV